MLQFYDVGFGFEITNRKKKRKNKICIYRTEAKYVDFKPTP
jgi:hypothetical protein